MRLTPGSRLNSCLRRGAVLVCMTSAGVVAMAQPSATDMVLRGPAEPLSCLVTPTGAAARPEFPLGVAGPSSAVVRVQLLFTSAQQPPQISVTYNNGGDAFADAVRRHLARYRLPCLRDGQTFTAAQEFQFVAKENGTRVLSGDARQSAALAVTAECMRGITDAKPPSWPQANVAFGAPDAGNVLLRIRFVGPAAPPQTVVLYDGGNSRLAAAAKASAATYRLPCMDPAGGSVTAEQQFNFRLTGAGVIGLKAELTLVELLGLVKGLEQQPVRFDFATMACPFTVRFAPRQPHSENYVAQVGDPDPNRREFVEWLRGLTLALPARMMRTAFGAELTVSVPCAVLDLS